MTLAPAGRVDGDDSQSVLRAIDDAINEQMQRCIWCYVGYIELGDLQRRALEDIPLAVQYSRRDAGLQPERLTHVLGYPVRWVESPDYIGVVFGEMQP